MSDTNDMRRDFEAWCKVRRGISTLRDLTPPANGGTGEYDNAFTNHAWWGWQAATKRATVLERERAAVLAYKAGMDGLAHAIRQGGTHD